MYGKMSTFPVFYDFNIFFIQNLLSKNPIESGIIFVSNNYGVNPWKWYCPIFLAAAYGILSLVYTNKITSQCSSIITQIAYPSTQTSIFVVP
jgi:hypothetical protein